MGIILAAWGSSSIEAWMPRDMTEQFPHFKTIMEEWDANTEAQEQIKAALAKGKWSGPEDVFMRPSILHSLQRNDRSARAILLPWSGLVSG